MHIIFERLNKHSFLRERNNSDSLQNTSLNLDSIYSYEILYFQSGVKRLFDRFYNSVPMVDLNRINVTHKFTLFLKIKFTFCFLAYRVLVWYLKIFQDVIV